MTSSPQLHDDLGARVESLVAAGDLHGAGALVGELHASDVADIVEGLSEDDRVALLSSLPVEVASEALAEMEEGEERGDLLAALAPEKGAELIEELPDDDAADLMAELEPPERRRIFEALPGDTAGDLLDLLSYDEETAGGLMTTELIAVGGSMTAAQALEQVRVQGREVEDFYTVFVVDGDIAAEDIALAASMLVPRLDELLDRTPEWRGRMAGIMQLVTLVEVDQALRERTWR